MPAVLRLIFIDFVCNLRFLALNTLIPQNSLRRSYKRAPNTIKMPPLSTIAWYHTVLQRYEVQIASNTSLLDLKQKLQPQLQPISVMVSDKNATYLTEKDKIKITTLSSQTFEYLNR